MSSQSRYSEYGYKKPRHEKRTIRIQGANDDDGMYYRCWNCGFPGNRIDRNTLGDNDGLGYEVVADTFDFPQPKNIPSLSMILNVSGSVSLLPTYQAQVTVKVSGCSFCGCMNYR